ncbi:MAG: hypothetical protein AB1806_11410 [Acidobacteriota bacterium]
MSNPSCIVRPSRAQRKGRGMLMGGFRVADPDLKKEIALKMKQLRDSNGNGGPALKVSLSDPAAIEDMIAKVSKRTEMVEAKRASTADPDLLKKIEQDLKSLTMTRKELKAKLAELKGGQPK